MTTLRCYHTWATNPADHHLHACAGLASCHPSPCRCACGALDYCTLHPARGTEDRSGEQLPHVADRPAGHRRLAEATS